MGYWVYLVRCGNNTIYTGATKDLLRRIKEHNRGSVKGKGAKYTAAHLPVVLAQAWEVGSWSEALRLERIIKNCQRAEKDRLIEQPQRICRLVEGRDFSGPIQAVSPDLIKEAE